MPSKTWKFACVPERSKSCSWVEKYCTIATKLFGETLEHLLRSNRFKRGRYLWVEEKGEGEAEETVDVVVVEERGEDTEGTEEEIERGETIVDVNNVSKVFPSIPMHLEISKV
jgi:hypothetical protein